jgi:hypothetical protein
MGLDQYAFVHEADGEREDIAYWRKHNRLEGWMEQLYTSKGGKDRFNCEEVEITLEDLEALEKAVRGRKLPKTEGFFFGSDSYEDMPPLLQLATSNASDEEIAKFDLYFSDDIKFINEARDALKAGKRVSYTSNW